MNSITPLGLKWELKQSFWMLFLLIPLTAPIGYLYIGVRAKQLKWIILGLIYFIIINGLSIVLWQISLDDSMSGLIVPAILICWLNALFSGLKVRVYYLTYLVESMNPNKRERLITAEKDRQKEKLRIKKEKNSPKMLSQTEIIEKQSERVKFIAKRKRQNEELKIININSASVNEISRLPGIGMILARKIVSVREQGNQFESWEHLIKVTKIQTEIIEEAYEFIAFSDDEVKEMKVKYERQQSRNNKTFGRKVDY